MGNLETLFALCALLKRAVRAEQRRKLNLVHFQRKTSQRVTTSTGRYDDAITLKLMDRQLSTGMAKMEN